MRILHTADWHLGRTLHGESLEQAVTAFFDWLVSIVQRESVDLVLVAGDIYDRGVPPHWAVRALDDVLQRLSVLTRVVLIPGNHDSATRLGFGSGLLRDSVTIRAEIGDIATPTAVTAGGDSVLVYSIPYLDPDLVRHLLGDGDRLPDRSHEAVMAAALDRIDSDLRSRGPADDVGVIVMAHAFMAGGLPSDSERNIEVGGASVVPTGLFDRLPKVDYVALGHLHRPQSIGNSGVEVRYSGSPMALSFSEATVPKSVTLLEFGGGGLESVVTLDTPVHRPLSIIRASIEELEGGGFDDFADHWLSITVTDDARPDRLVPRVRRLFPHALTIAHEPRRGVGLADIRRVTRDVDPREILGQFFADVGGRPLTPAESAALDVVLGALRRQEEAS